MAHSGAITAIPHELGADQFEIVVRKLADDLTYGTDLSRFVGTGVDYAQTRPFSYGDSVKSIDWRVTARTGKYHVKEYESVKRVGVFVVVDTSASMSVASGLHTHATKHDYATWIAGALAVACLRRRSPVCLLSCGERDGQVAPTLSRGQVWRAIELLRHPGREERTNVAAALQRVESLAHNTSAVVLISDLHDPTAVPAIRRIGQRHDAMVMRVRDPAERHGLGAGFYRGVEAESGREFLGTSRGGFGDGDIDPLAGSGMDHTTIWTDEPIIPKVAQMLATRGGAGRAAR